MSRFATYEIKGAIEAAVEGGATFSLPHFLRYGAMRRSCSATAWRFCTLPMVEAGKNVLR